MAWNAPQVAKNAHAGCSLVNAPPIEGSVDTTGDTVHAVSKDYLSAIENTRFATAGLYVQAAIFPDMNQTGS